MNALPIVCVWPDRFTPGLTSLDASDPPPSHELVDPFEAFTTAHDTDAHAVGYAVPGAEAQPRLKLEALASLIKAGIEPLMRWVFVDVDNAQHRKWESKDEARTSMAALFGAGHPLLSTAGYYTTSSGFRLMWCVAGPDSAGIPVGLYTSWADAFLLALSKQTGIPFADHRPKERGGTGAGGIDSTCNQWTRCYRLPFVQRADPGEAPFATDPAIDLARCFRAPLTWMPRERLQRQVAVPSAGAATVAGAPPMPAVADVTDAEWMAVAESKYAGAMRHGTPLAKKGDRDSALLRAIGDIVGTFDSADPSLPWRFLARAVAADTSDGAPDLAKLWDRCQYIANKQRAQHTVRAMVKVTPVIVTTPNSTGFYVLNEKTMGYMPPVKANAICHALETYCPSMGLVARSMEGKPLKADEYLANYGALAYRVHVEMGRALTTYNPDTQTMTEGCCVLRDDITPTYHADVDTWLRLLAGGDAEHPAHVGRFLDWIATLTQLDRPTCAAYVEGDHSAGKSMLPTGLAQLWSSGPTSYADAVGNFNSALTSNPLVHADETMAGAQGAGFSAGFRSLTGETYRQLRRKYQESGTLQGCPRLLVTANNGDALCLVERLTQADLAAIVVRILHLRASVRASAYLHGLGGRPGGTADWVTRDNKPGKIAEHALWLRDHRPVSPGPRFLVEGIVSDFHRDLALTHGHAQSVLSALAHHVMKAGKSQHIVYGPIGGPGNTAGVVDVPPDEIWVNAPALKAAWTAATGNTPMAEHELGAALRALASGVARPRIGGSQVRCHVIPVASVVRIAELFQIAEPEVIRARLMGNNARVGNGPPSNPTPPQGSQP